MDDWPGRAAFRVGRSHAIVTRHMCGCGMGWEGL